MARRYRLEKFLCAPVHGTPRQLAHDTSAGLTTFIHVSCANWPGVQKFLDKPVHHPPGSSAAAAAMGRRPSSLSSASETETSVSSADSELEWPFGSRLDTLRRAEIRETAYEIFFMSCRSSAGFGGGGRGSILAVGSGGETLVEVSSSPTRPVVGPRGGTGMMAVTSRIKNSLGLKARRPPPMRTMNPMGLTSMAVSSPIVVPNSPSRIRRPMTSAEIMRQQMRVTEQSDGRLRKILMRSFVGQNGRKAETIILPLELLRHLKPSDFSDVQEYHQWQRRQLKILEAGLLLHPSLPLDRLNAATLRFREVLRQSEAKPIDTSKNSEAMRSLSSAVTALAWRSSSSSNAENCHWADGFPFNLHLYLALIRSIFDLREETVVLDEVDELMELVKKTWPTLGINRMIHNVCFAWVLFQQYVATGQVEPDLIRAALNMLGEVASDAKRPVDHEQNYVKVLSGVLASMQRWAEKRLVDYHEHFDKGTMDNMENLLSLALSTGKIMGEDLAGMAGSTPALMEQRDTSAGSVSSRVEHYIRSSLRNAFTKVFETGHGYVDSMIVEVDEDPSDILTQLAKDTEALAAAEREIFSPVLRRWCPSAGGLALVILHGCFGIVLKQYLAKVATLTNELIRVLHCAGRLEKLLMQMVTEEAMDQGFDDGGKSLLKEMIPYEVDTIAVSLLKSWMDERIRIGRECLIRAKETESWMPKSKGEPFAQSAVDLIKLAKMTTDEFFEIPVMARDEMVQNLTEGFETIFQEYTKFVASCGNRQSYVPMLPPLTRCNQDSRFAKLWKKALCTVGTDIPRIGAGGGGSAGGTPAGETHHPRPSTSRGTQRLYIRINTLHYLHSHIHSLDKSLTFFSRGGASNLPGPSPQLRHHQNLHPNRRLAPASHFTIVRASIQSAIQHVSQVAAYRLIFLDSAHSFYDGLYIGDVAKSRIRPWLRILKQNLNLLLTLLTDRAQPTAVKEVMRATFEAFLLVLLAGGTDRAFVRTDSEMVMEDFRNLKRVFCASGEGLVAEEVVDREAEAVEGVIGLMSLPTERLIEDFIIAASEARGKGRPGEGHRLQMPPPPTGRWSRSDPYTVLRVICNRNDDTANNFLKKTFQLPKRR
ncbi:hypothetical protein AXF42_Ash003696 [Apostasia shenzhenica]|uniref:MHD1 domain-containing protein n=1 Tax=Apostasia shenzhenica TaxID=1088818 RepID=A0A2I0AHM3_9ASPA|nr:hypothetical protein AXF42_Ash003696 [Apostasia shenzhenica]